MSNRARTLLFQAICFLVPFCLYYFTQSSSLMFDDAAEFATVIKQGSNAHPPGFPAYVLAGFVWDHLLSLFTHRTIFILNLFSITVSSAGILLFYRTIRTVLMHVDKGNISYKHDFIAAATALCLATEVTTWTWSNTIEVYALQMFCMSLLLFGLVHFQVTGKRLYILAASLGFALALSNHHLTMILFAPFIPFFFMPGLFVFKNQSPADKKKKVKTVQRSFVTEYFSVFRMKPFWIMVSVTTIVTAGFYFWMYVRAQRDYPFMFGKPDSLDQLIYHVTGGSYAKNIEQTSKNILLSRIPYFFQLTFFQFLFFLPLLMAGLVFLVRKKMLRLFSVVLVYFLFLLAYQVNNNQWENTDAYMLLPFMVLTIPVAFGALGWFEKMKLNYVLPAALLIQGIINFPKCDRRNYAISESLMHQLDVSAPPNSIIIIADWSLVMQYYYSRIVENFRPDLIVLHQDIKFNHYRVVPTLYPQFYQSIQPEYDHFIAELSKEHPRQVTNTGCDLSTWPLMNSFHALITRIETLAREQNRTLLTDPRANYFMVQQKFYSPERFVSGCFISSVKTDNNDEFLEFRMPWLSSPMLQNDLTALNKMVDYQAMFDSHIAYYRASNDQARLAKAEAGKEKVMKIQRELRKNISFAYKLK